MGIHLKKCKRTTFKSCQPLADSIFQKLKVNFEAKMGEPFIESNLSSRALFQGLFIHSTWDVLNQKEIVYKWIQFTNKLDFIFRITIYYFII